jgi:folate-binding protein YgfZ
VTTSGPTTTGSGLAAPDVVVVRGPDTWTFLQSLLSQDVEGMADGDVRASLLLTPQGKVDVTLTIRRDGADARLETDAGWGLRLVEALGRYRIRTKVEIELVERAPEPTADQEAARIAAGVPRLGADLDDSVIPQEAFLEREAVSFTKGCFVGQELVCRIDTRGHVNRYLRHLVPGDAATVLPAGADVVAGEKVVGKVTSAASGIALGFVRREVDPGSVVHVDGREVTVRELHR